MTFSHLGLLIIIAASVLLPLWLYVESTGGRLAIRLITGLALLMASAGSVLVLAEVAGASRLHFYEEVLYRLGDLASTGMGDTAVAELARYREAAAQVGPEGAVRETYGRLAFRGR